VATTKGAKSLLQKYCQTRTQRKAQAYCQIWPPCKALMLGHRLTAIATATAQTLCHRYTARNGNHVRHRHFDTAILPYMATTKCPLSVKIARKVAHCSIYTRLSIHLLFSPSSEQMLGISDNYYIFWVCAALGIQHAMRMIHIDNCGLLGSTILFRIISRTAQFSKKKIIEHDLYFNFLCKFCLKSFSFQEELRDTRIR
jgi:hypothetical protein